MTELQIAWRNLLFRPVLTMISAAILGAAVALAIAVLLLSRAMEDGLVRASRPFDLLVGAKGSPTQLIMSTILLQDTLVGNIPFDYFETLRRDPRVAHAVPLAMGDSVRGFRIVGVGPEFFVLADPVSQRPYFAVAEGRVFETTFEAVLGAQVTATWRMSLHDSFQSQHGLLEGVPGAAHQANYTIVGILKPSHTPLDRAVFVPLDSYWEVHDATAREITVAMLRPVGIKEFYQLYQEINQGTAAQAVLTGQGMARLFDLLGHGQAIFTKLCYLALIMGAATVFLVSYAVGAQRRRETAILRALGAGRWSVFVIGLAEPLITAAWGTMLGVVAGHLVAWYIASRLHEASAIAIRPTFMIEELMVVGAALLLSAIAGLIPAIESYRQDVATNLAPT
jgi:putative ABC transport system permease protein